VGVKKKMARDEDMVSEYADSVLSGVKFLRGKITQKHFPKIHKRFRDELEALKAEGEDEAEDEGEGISPTNPKLKLDASSAKKTFDSQSERLLQRVAAEKFGVKFRKK
jgi:hypothetical protein